MANDFTTSYMALLSDIDEIDFIGAGTNFQYMDDTLSIDTPDVEESRFSSSSYAGRGLKDVVYKTRNIKFEIEVYGTNDGDLMNNVARLRRLISISTSPFYLSGGAHELISDYTNYTRQTGETGDSGLLFGIRVGKDAGTSYTGELQIVYGNKNIIFARVIKAHMTGGERYFSASRTRTVNGVAKKSRLYSIELECEPYLFSPSRLIKVVGEPGLKEGQVSPVNAYTNRIIIPAADIVGTEPALTRITTHIAGGQGIIIGRDAGISMLNSPAFPKMTTGSGLNDIYVLGDVRNATGKSYKVRISATGAQDSVQISTNGGSSYGASTPISALSRIQLGSDNAYIYFEKQTGHTLNNEWTFYSHQTVTYLNSTKDIYANRNATYQETGYLVGTLYYVIPPGCHSRYKLYGRVATTGFTPELSSKIYYGGYSDWTVSKLYSGGAQSDWTTIAETSNWADLGIIDLTSNGMPSSMHPGASGEIKIEIYARTLSTIQNPANITIDLVYLFPCPDENSWFHAGWTDDGDQHEHYCNYDLSAPYMVETMLSGSGVYGRVMPLNGTYGGNYITLIPNVDNTIMMVPLDSGTSDWRRTEFLNIGQTGYTTISYKPRYMVL